jgi:hypothetical protein
VVAHYYISNSTLVTHRIVAGEERTNHIGSDPFNIEGVFLSGYLKFRGSHQRESCYLEGLNKV